MSDINERQLRGMFHRDFIENFSGKRVSFDNYLMKIRSSPYIMSQQVGWVDQPNILQVALPLSGYLKSHRSDS